MRAQGAAPGELASKLRGDALDGNASNPTRFALPTHVLETVAAIQGRKP